MCIRDSLKSTYRIDVEKGFEIGKRADLNKGRYYLDSNTVDNEHIYVLGGRDYETFLSSCEKYSITEDKWTLIKPLNMARDCINSGVMDSRYIYAIDGRLHGVFFECVEKFDTCDEEAGWQLLGFSFDPFSRQPKGGSWCIQVSPTELLIAGGTRTFNDTATDEVWILNTRNMKAKECTCKLPVGAELYTPAVVYGGSYYQLKYCNRGSNYDLIQFNVMTKEFKVTKFKQIWRKRSL
eukprot:TRINITY_DN2441_c0_g1_i2.p1 TRINITY_DN2441_c0_g1~~TRINITY_DN2441_c0_g1_i2.p1  ORF type:complete len:237 (+),score=52.89 TRINITY_DN2441_c0_g1_i2:70-780(+)